MAHLMNDKSCDDFTGLRPSHEAVTSLINSERENAQPSPFAHDSSVLSREEWVPSGTTIWGAEKILQESNRVSFSVMRSVKSGSPIEIAMVKTAIERMVANALVSDQKIVVLNRIERGDECSFLHVVNVAFLTISFLHSLHYDTSLIEEVAVGAFLHDIGKARVPDTLLCKREVLTSAEVATIKDHVRYTCTLLSSTEGVSPLSLLVASQHHERYGGTGYPNGLKGDEISIYSQALSLVDMYDAITSCRCYSKSENSEEALRQIERLGGVYFNDFLVKHFIPWIREYLVTQLKAPMGRSVTVMIGPDYTGHGSMAVSNGGW